MFNVLEKFRFRKHTIKVWHNLKAHPSYPRRRAEQCVQTVKRAHKTEGGICKKTKIKPSRDFFRQIYDKRRHQSYSRSCVFSLRSFSYFLFVVRGIKIEKDYRRKIWFAENYLNCW